MEYRHGGPGLREALDRRLSSNARQRLENEEKWTFDHLIEGEDYFKDAFMNCHGIIFLSQRRQDYWHSRLSTHTGMSAFPTWRNTVALKHPVDIHEEVQSFDLKQLQQTPNKKVVLLGQQLRRVHTIYQLEVGPSYEKVWSPGCPEEGFPRMLTFAIKQGCWGVRTGTSL